MTLASNFNPDGYEPTAVADSRTSGGQGPEPAAEVGGGMSGDRQAEPAARSKRAAAPLSFSERADTVQPPGARAVRRRGGWRTLAGFYFFCGRLKPYESSMVALTCRAHWVVTRIESQTRHAERRSPLVMPVGEYSGHTALLSSQYL